MSNAATYAERTQGIVSILVHGDKPVDVFIWLWWPRVCRSRRWRCGMASGVCRQGCIGCVLAAANHRRVWVVREMCFLCNDKEGEKVIKFSCQFISNGKLLKAPCWYIVNQAPPTTTKFIESRVADFRVLLSQFSFPTFIRSDAIELKWF